MNSFQKCVNMAYNMGYTVEESINPYTGKFCYNVVGSADGFWLGAQQLHEFFGVEYA